MSRNVTESTPRLRNPTPLQVAHLAGTGPGYGPDEALAPLAEAVAAGDPRTRNLYFDVATNVTPTIVAATARQVAMRIRQIGTERILFGSDIDPASSPRQEWGTFRGMIPLTDAEFRAHRGQPHAVSPASEDPSSLSPRP